MGLQPAWPAEHKRRRTVGDGDDCDGSPDEVAALGRKLEVHIVPPLNCILRTGNARMWSTTPNTSQVENAHRLRVGGVGLVGHRDQRRRSERTGLTMRTFVCCLGEVSTFSASVEATCSGASGSRSVGCEAHAHFLHAALRRSRLLGLMRQ